MLNLTLAERLAYWRMVLRQDWTEDNPALNRMRFEETQAALRDSLETLRAEIRSRELGRPDGQESLSGDSTARQPELFRSHSTIV